MLPPYNERLNVVELTQAILDLEVDAIAVDHRLSGQ